MAEKYVERLNDLCIDSDARISGMPFRVALVNERRIQSIINFIVKLSSYAVFDNG